MKIITLTLNPAFDIHCYTEHFEPYHENLAEITARESGGKGVNISRALTANNVDNLALLVLGEENAASFRAGIESDGMNYLEITVPGRIRENITLHTENADETRISFRGFKTDNSLTDSIYDSVSGLLEEGSIVTLTGSLPSGIDMTAVKSLLSRLTSHGARIVIDSRSFTTDDLIEARPWLIKPNQEEISDYLGCRVSGFEDVAGAARRLHEDEIANVMISLGAQGALLVCNEGTFVATPPKIDALSTVGAGDSSIAGFIAAATKGKSSAEMLRTAVAYGSAACLREGTRPPLPTDVAEIYNLIEVKKTVL